MMKTPLIFLLIVALVLAQGLRFCVHAPDTVHAGEAQHGLVHYESDSSPDSGVASHDFDVTYLLQGLDLYTLLAGRSALALLLLFLLLLAGHGQRLFFAQDSALTPSHGFRLRPPLRAPPH
jgi:hypothetical protein